MEGAAALMFPTNQARMCGLIRPQTRWGNIASGEAEATNEKREEEVEGFSGPRPLQIVFPFLEVFSLIWQENNFIH